MKNSSLGLGYVRILYMSLNTRYFFYYDLGLIIFGIVILFFAYRKGFVRQLGDVLTLMATMVISTLASPFFAREIPLMTARSEFEILERLQDSALQIVNTFLWFLILFFGLRILYRFLAFALHSKKKTVLSFANHLLGLVLGIVKVFLLGAVLSLILRFPLIQYGDVYLNQSVLRAWDPAIDSMIDYWEGWIHHETE